MTSTSIKQVALIPRYFKAVTGLTLSLLLLANTVNASDGREASLYQDNNLRIADDPPQAAPSLFTDDIYITKGNTPTLRLDQDSTSGFTPQTWELAGNEVSFFIRDITGGDTSPFRIQPSAPSNTLYLRNNGNIGFGTTLPQASLHIVETNASEDFLIIAEATNTSPESQVFKVEPSGDTTILGNLDVGSSRNLKQNIEEISGKDALEALDELNPVHFSYRATPDVHSLGFIAEDVPEIVATDDRRTLRPMDLVALLTKVTQEQQKTIEDLSAQLNHLQNVVKNQQDL